MEDHLLEKDCVQPVPFGGGPHLGKHFPENQVHPPLVEPQIHLGSDKLSAAGNQALHGFDALGLPGADALGRAAEARVLRGLQNVPAHPDSGPLVREHLDNEIAGDALGESGGGDALDHLVQDLVVTAQILLGFIAEQICISHGFALLLPIL